MRGCQGAYVGISEVSCLSAGKSWSRLFREQNILSFDFLWRCGGVRLGGLRVMVMKSGGGYGLNHGTQLIFSSYIDDKKNRTAL